MKYQYGTTHKRRGWICTAIESVGVVNERPVWKTEIPPMTREEWERCVAAWRSAELLTEAQAADCLRMTPRPPEPETK